MDKRKYISLPHMCGFVPGHAFSSHHSNCLSCTNKALSYQSFDIKSLHICLGNFPAPFAPTLYLDFLQNLLSVIALLLLCICFRASLSKHYWGFDLPFID